ncbi:hypothetical protein GPX89_42730 [Nocardia sp. ET3-3]|uniref:Uncharacterized protein n=1 Tax=Nocardia terrae TaxID=2675851 RepID=A0A7K1VC02_9NOCA|nr:MYXO-CTERM sorting domain-containing protein [Nocardia terrae]MVU83932.1 hypothetical protein [Nocardia terrae]
MRFGTVALLAGSVSDQLPDYSRTEIWVGSAILLVALLALLVAVLRRR